MNLLSCFGVEQSLRSLWSSLSIPMRGLGLYCRKLLRSYLTQSPMAMADVQYSVQKEKAECSQSSKSSEQAEFERVEGQAKVRAGGRQ